MSHLPSQAQEDHEEAVYRYFDSLTDPALRLEGAGSTSLAAWFLGPKAENESLLLELVKSAVIKHGQDRKSIYHQDPIYVTEAMRHEAEFQEGVKVLYEKYAALLNALKHSVPFFSYRYLGHMNWDITLPAALGYFAAMLYNPNNVATEASPVTTYLEMEVGKDLCRMLGYDPEAKTNPPWGHITCDGSVANLESLWVARNLKYYSFTIAHAVREEKKLKEARHIKVRLGSGKEKKLLSLSQWELLNLPIDVTLALPGRIREECDISEETLNAVLEPHTLQHLGFPTFYSKFLDKTEPPVTYATATMHYSWPKGAAILGLGKEHVYAIKIDGEARLDVADLRGRLAKCMEQEKPVIMVMIVLGSTGESAVDPLAEVLKLRDKFRKKGLEFYIHVDAAWGGYFASMLRDDKLSKRSPTLPMSKYVRRQFEALPWADSITIDPHKAGYIPYPAGALCYRDKRLRNLVTFAAPIVSHDGLDPTVGIYGVEGSKAGAAAASVYLSHQVIRPTKRGYGQLLGQCMFNCKRLYMALLNLDKKNDNFVIASLHRQPAERHRSPHHEEINEADIQEELDKICNELARCSNEELQSENFKDQQLFHELGSDLNILAYAFNFKTRTGHWNQDIALANQLNEAIFKRFSLRFPSPEKPPELPPSLMLTQATFSKAVHGENFLNQFAQRMKIENFEGDTITYLISTVMDPWLTDTSEGTFIPTLMNVLEMGVLAEIEKIG